MKLEDQLHCKIESEDVSFIALNLYMIMIMTLDCKSLIFVFLKVFG